MTNREIELFHYSELRKCNIIIDERVVKFNVSLAPTVILPNGVHITKVNGQYRLFETKNSTQHHIVGTPLADYIWNGFIETEIKKLDNLEKLIDKI